MKIYIALFFMMVALFLGILLALGVQERNECEGWQRYSAEAINIGLKSFDWQKEQCKVYNIELGY